VRNVHLHLSSNCAGKCPVFLAGYLPSRPAFQKCWLNSH